MSRIIQNYLARNIQKAAADLEAALLRIPEDKRHWKPAETSRSALDQLAECALLNGSTAQIIADRAWPENYDFAEYENEKNELCHDWNKMRALLHQNASRAVNAILAVPDEDLETTVEMPWGPMTLEQVSTYPFWNMSYHEGQINYIASILGCLK